MKISHKGKHGRWKRSHLKSWREVVLRVQEKSSFKLKRRCPKGWIEVFFIFTESEGSLLQISLIEEKSS